MQAFISSRQFKTSLSLHTYGDLWLHPYGYALVIQPTSRSTTRSPRSRPRSTHYTAGATSFVLYLAQRRGRSTTSTI
jgi:hypothetical protein